jgi:succinate dehydrogenase/fumarate reductase flavoprotein subunit
MPWNIYIDFLNMIDVSQMVASSALLRKEKRGAHFRQDYPEQNDKEYLYNLFLKKGENGQPVFEKKPVSFTHKSLDECQNYTKKPPETK